MPWKELSKMDERMRFVARLMEGEKTVVLCRKFDILRKTGYKLYSRYKNSGARPDGFEPPTTWFEAGTTIYSRRLIQMHK